MRGLVFAAGLATLSLANLAAASDAAKVRAAYERLCTGDAPGSVATCAALRREVDDAGVPGTTGWSGVMVGAPAGGVKAARVFAVDPKGPGAAAGLRTGDLIISADNDPVSDSARFVAAAATWRSGQLIRLGVLRGEQVLDVPIKLATEPTPAPILNSQRTSRGAYSIWDGAALTQDKLQVGESFYGILEHSDASSAGGRREDCIEVVSPGPSRNLVAHVTPNGGGPMRLYVLPGRCDWGIPSTAYATGDGKAVFGANFATQAGGRTFLMVSGASSAKPYRVVVRELTESETIAWRDQVRRNEIAAQQRRAAEARAAAESQQMWGAALQGLVLGATGAEMPAMRADGTMPNMLDTLNAANAALEAKNAESAARLNATIARAQAQAEQQRREQEARAEAERRANDARTRAQAPAPATRPPAYSPSPSTPPPPAQRSPQSGAPSTPPATPAPTQQAQGPVPPVAPQATSRTSTPPAQKICRSPARTTEWRTSMSALTLGDATAEYNEVRASPCKGGGGSISAMQCEKKVEGLGATWISVCRATISCPAREYPCNASAVSAQ